MVLGVLHAEEHYAVVWFSDRFLKRAFPTVGFGSEGSFAGNGSCTVRQYLELSLEYPCLWVAWGGRREEGLIERFHVSMKAEVYMAARFHSTFLCN